MIGQLFNKGNSFVCFPFKVSWMSECKDSVLQAGVGVSNRHFKKATHRNRIKRLMRESYRLQKNPLQDYLGETSKQLSIFVLYVGKELPAYEIVYDKMGVILKRLLKSVHGDAQKDH